jgi:hypothetical protein
VGWARWPLQKKHLNARREPKARAALTRHEYTKDSSRSGYVKRTFGVDCSESLHPARRRSRSQLSGTASSCYNSPGVGKGPRSLQLPSKWFASSRTAGDRPRIMSWIAAERLV